MNVEIDLFSGRPNPRFALAPDDVTDLVRRLTALPPTTDRAPAPVLGYRGMRIRDETGESPVTEVQVFGGTAVLHDHHGDQHLFRDPDRALERRLLDLAAPHVEPAVVGLVRQELGSPGHA